jgi:hypothetical protein
MTKATEKSNIATRAGWEETIVELTEVELKSNGLSALSRAPPRRQSLSIMLVLVFVLNFEFLSLEGLRFY